MALMGNDEQMQQPQGLGLAPNSSMELINLKREQDKQSMTDKIRQDERARVYEENMRDADIQRQMLQQRNQGFEEGASAIAGRRLGPQNGEDINSYLANGLQNGTLAPEEAMAAVNEPSVSPELRQILAESLGQGQRPQSDVSRFDIQPAQESQGMPQGLGSIPVRR